MSQTSAPDRDLVAINTLRFLAVDMVEAARSGHPGAPMGQAPLAYMLWSRFLRHSPAHPRWLDRDRFVLSCGHASALLYGLLHLSGYDLPLSELQRFRQLGSRTPGHPEHRLTAGVETTTGPLGQGFANAVGMAIAERFLAARFNRPGFPVVDHRIWVLASDGDLMEGVSSEAASLAGHLKLGKLCVIYDDNLISIDGPTSLTFSEDVGARFAAYGWHVERVEDGNDLEALEAAYAAAAGELQRPSLVMARTHIGYGSPNKQDTAAAHGEPLGAEEVAATKHALGWPLEPAFHIPPEAREAFASIRQRGERLESEWNSLLVRYGAAFPEAAEELRAWQEETPPEGWDQELPRFSSAEAPVATRAASGKVLQAVAGSIGQLIGGSADLAGSNKALIGGSPDFSASAPHGRNLRFGIREHAMGSILNGIALSGMLRPYGATFLVFSDYLRPALRLAALMELPVIYVFTHDSIFVGEDGPTHQPISQLAALRAIPGMTVLRPADACETVEAWRLAILNSRGPTALVLARQKVPILAETAERAADGVGRGAYVLADAKKPRLLLIATGSEVPLVLEAHRLLAAEKVPSRVVSMPSWELFAAQPQAYRDEVLPPALTKRLAVEAAAPLGWERWVGAEGEVLAMSGFGASAPSADLAERFGFTPREVVARALRLVRAR